MGELGKHIQTLRHKKGLTVRALAEKVQKTAGYFSRMEMRDEIPSADLLCRLSEILDEKPEHLLELAKQDLLKRAEVQIEQKSSEALNLYRRTK